jgi:Sigma-70, region 4
MDGTATAEIAPASARLPERQRRALTLHEQEGLSYGEIAARIETSHECVAQLLGHAWINLYDELGGTVLASVSPSPECERGLGLIAARDDGELDTASADGKWLEAHLEACGRCRRAVDETREARAHFRSAEPAPEAGPVPRRRIAVVGAVAGLLLLAGVATAVVRDDSTVTSAERANGVAGGVGGAAAGRQATPAFRSHANSASRGKAAKGGSGARRDTVGDAPTAAAAPAPVVVPAGGSTNGGSARREPSAGPESPARTAVEPPRRTAAPRTVTRKAPPAAATPPPASTPSAAPTETAPPEESVSEHPGRGEPPRKPADRPPNK